MAGFQFMRDTVSKQPDGEQLWKTPDVLLWPPHVCMYMCIDMHIYSVACNTHNRTHACACTRMCAHTHTYGILEEVR